MPERRFPQPRERHAERFRQAHEEWDLKPIGRYERSGWGRSDGFHGEYERRPEYSLPRGVLYPPEPEGSGWPSPIHTTPPESEERHLRALRDRDLARSVDAALHTALGRTADRIAVYADDAVITLRGRVHHPAAARDACESAWAVPGVRRVRCELSWPRRMPRRPGWG